MAASSPPTMAPTAVRSIDIEMMENSTTSSEQPSPDQETFIGDGHDRSAFKSETMSTQPGDHDDPSKLMERPGGPSSEGHRQDDGVEYPRGVKLSLIVVALCLAVFLMALDNSVISTAIPKITDEFQSLEDVGWYGSAYLLTTCALQLLFGKFYKFWTIKWVFLTAIGIFELGSLVCGAAPNSTALILGRAIAGLGSSGIFSGALLILAHSAPLEKRPTYIGLIGGMYGIASIAGPLLGGAFTDRLTWRWCFYINLPIGALTVLVVLFFFSDPKRDIPPAKTLLERVRQLDPIGATFFLPAIISLLLALQWGGTRYSWSNGRIIALFVVFGVLMLGFFYVQYRQGENATVPPRIIAHRSVWAGCLYGFCSSSTFFLMIYYVPIWFQAVQSTSAVESGIRNLPMLISTILFSIASGGLVTKLGYYTPFMIAATVLMSIGAGLISTFKPDTGSPAWIGYQVLFGLGYGTGSRQPLVAVQTVLNIDDVPAGTSVSLFCTTLGGALFVSIGQSVFTNQLVQSLTKLVPSLDPRAVVSAGATDLQRILPAKLLPNVILAYNTALTTAFLVSVAMASMTVFGSLLMPWDSVKKKTDEASPR